MQSCPPPRYGTARRPERATLGPQVAATAAALGQPLQGWQRHAADVFGEYELVEDDAGRVTIRLCYRRWGLSVGRRAGKSLFDLAYMLTRARATNQRVWYSAQSGKQVSRKWRQEWSPQVARSALRTRFAARLSQGNEEFVNRARNSYVSAFAPSREELHSQSGDLILFDECWAHAAATGDELLQAATPLIATRRNAQLGFTSAAGDVDSTWWQELVDTGRLAAAVDTGHGFAYLEWSADVGGLAGVEQLDLDDPAVWAESHPAVGSLIELDFLADEHALDPAAFRRQYLNVRDTTGTAASPIDAASWSRCRDGVELLDRSSPVALAVDCGEDQATSTIAACGGDTVPRVEVLEYAAGHGWVVDAVERWMSDLSVSTVTIDPGGPAVAVRAGLRRVAGRLDEVDLRSAVEAASGFVEAVRTDAVEVVPSGVLDDAVPVARRRRTGDGSWLFDRRSSLGDVSPLIAVALARYRHPTVAGVTPGVG